MTDRKKQLQSAIAILALELELKEGRRLNIYKGVEEVVKVIQFAFQSNDIQILEYLQKVSVLLSPNQLSFFNSKGMDLQDDLNKKVHLLISAIEKANLVTRGIESKKVIYRGQVKWV